jgi:hypothetical protein
MCSVVHFIRISLTSHEYDLVFEVEMHSGQVIWMVFCNVSVDATTVTMPVIRIYKTVNTCN